MILKNLITKFGEKRWVSLKKNRAISPLIFKKLIVLLVLVHFLILFIYQLNDNPLKHQYKYEIHNYVEPFFSQRWTLFAPNPINSNMSLLMCFKYKLDSKSEWETTEWIDITEPLIIDRKKNFWSPAQRINKFTQSCMSEMIDSHRLLLKKIKEKDTLRQDTLKARKYYRKMYSNVYGHKALLKYSSYISENFFNENRLKPYIIKVKYKVINAKFPRFSKRNEDYYDLKNYEFDDLISEYYEIQRFNTRD